MTEAEEDLSGHYQVQESRVIVIGSWLLKHVVITAHFSPLARMAVASA